MKLSKEDAELFYKLNWGLLYHVNKEYPIIKGLNSPDFKGQVMEDVAELDEKLYSHPELIDSFVRENPFYFSAEELNIIKNWRKLSVKGEFFIFSSGDKMIFLSSGKEAKVYEAIGIWDEIKDIIPFEPYMTKAVLLPFKGKIIYSGFLCGYSITFGGGMKKTVTEDFLKAKRKFGIISSLEQPKTEKNESYEELLKFYLKNEKGRFDYGEDIEEILHKNPDLIKVYHQEIGKSNARKMRKRFSILGINPGWFAVFNDVIIASGKSEKDVLEKIKDIVPEDKRDGVFVFKYEKKNNRGA